MHPSYLPFDAAHLDDEAALPIALDDLLAREPLSARSFTAALRAAQVLLHLVQRDAVGPASQQMLKEL